MKLVTQPSLFVHFLNYTAVSVVTTSRYYAMLQAFKNGCFGASASPPGLPAIELLLPSRRVQNKAEFEELHTLPKNDNQHYYKNYIETTLPCCHSLFALLA